MAELIPRLLDLRHELQPGKPIAIGALVGPMHVGHPSWELPWGARAGTPEELAEVIAGWSELGVSHLQLRFPSRSVGELCEQMSAFAESVVPLVAHCVAANTLSG